MPSCRERPAQLGHQGEWSGDADLDRKVILEHFGYSTFAKLLNSVLWRKKISPDDNASLWSTSPSCEAESIVRCTFAALAGYP